MVKSGILEAMAQADLEAMVQEIARGYRPGAFETFAAADPGWRAALDGAEREVGGLYAALCDADGTLTRWPAALAELRRLWTRVGEAPSVPAAASLENVA